MSSSVRSVDPVSLVSPGPEGQDSVVADPRQLPPEAEIQAWLVAYLSELLDIDAGEIDVTDTLAAYGLDSSAVIGMVGDLGTWLGRKLEPKIVYSYPTIETLTRYLVERGGR